MSASFEADLAPDTHFPRFRMSFENGWTISIALAMPANGTKCDFHLANVAACPTGQWRQSKTELLHHEAFPDEVAKLIAEVCAREKPE
jgi:hypothetical protein